MVAQGFTLLQGGECHSSECAQQLLCRRVDSGPLGLASVQTGQGYSFRLQTAPDLELHQGQHAQTNREQVDQSLNASLTS